MDAKNGGRPECGDGGTASARGGDLPITPGYWKSSVPTTRGAGRRCRSDVRGFCPTAQTALRGAWSTAEVPRVIQCCSRGVLYRFHGLALMAVGEFGQVELRAGLDGTAITL
jgi:hypothetical protein